MEEAKAQILAIVDPPKAEIGKVYTGRVVNITKFGAFVNILPGRDGLVHISKLGGGKRINSVEDVLELGDEIEVRVEEIDDRGKVSLVPAGDWRPPSIRSAEGRRSRGPRSSPPISRRSSTHGVTSWSTSPWRPAARDARCRGWRCTASTPWWAPPVSPTTTSPCSESSFGRRRPQLRDRPNFAISAVLMMRFAEMAAPVVRHRRDHRTAPRPQGRRAVGHGDDHRRAHGGRVTVGRLRPRPDRPTRCTRVPAAVSGPRRHPRPFGADAGHGGPPGGDPRSRPARRSRSARTATTGRQLHARRGPRLQEDRRAPRPHEVPRPLPVGISPGVRPLLQSHCDTPSSE
jgi:predicted RNA-binding protein with RPS1 domain